MPIGDTRAHFGNALRWSRRGELEGPKALVDGLGMGLNVLFAPRCWTVLPGTTT